MVDGGTLVGDLETALAHSEVHGVHVDHAWEWLVLSGLGHVGFLVLVNGHLDLNLLASPLSYRLNEATKARMRVDRLIKNKS